MKRTLFSILVLAILSITALAVPNQLTYSGRLLQNGALVNSPLAMTFSIYDAATGGNLLWTQPQPSVEVNQGIYSVLLGDTSNPISSNVFVTDNAYLQVVVAGETLSPRTKINSVGYALQAASVTGLSNVFPSSGNVGIGNPGPWGVLDIRKTPQPNAPHLLFGDQPAISGQSAAKLLFAGNGIQHAGMYWVPVTSGIGRLHFSFGGSGDPSMNVTKMTIQNDGKVGIGTTAPEYVLQVQNRFGVSDQGVIYWGQDASSTTPVYKGFLSWDVDRVMVGGNTPATDLSLYANGSEKIRVNSSGKIGIGLTNPGAKLTVVNSTASTESFRVDGLSGGAMILANNGTVWGNSSVGIMGSNLYVTTGNVGIGTLYPSAKLGVTTVEPGALVNRSILDLYHMYNNGANGHILQFLGVANAGTYDAFNIVSRYSHRLSLGALAGAPSTTPKEDFTILSDGNVGIGTANVRFSSNDARFLAVSASGKGNDKFSEIGAGGNILTNGSWAGVYSFFNEAISAPEKRIAAIASSLEGSTGSGNISFWTMKDGSIGEKMRLTSAGYVGIGTTAPAGALDVNGIAYFRSNVYLGGYTMWGLGQLSFNNGNYIKPNDPVNYAFTVYSGTPAAAALTIRENGNVGIGTTAPGTDKLDVRGRAYASGGWMATDADYAEWFEKEEDAKAGDIIGINLQTGKTRKYRAGDKFIGVYSTNPAYVGNRLQETDQEMSQTHLLVGLLGQLEFAREQVVLEGRLVKTSDGKEIGVLLSNGKVLVGR
ncbi:MAG: hypothetical protein WC838_05950 [Candidatus Margulisiibacteriota bacterium]